MHWRKGRLAFLILGLLYRKGPMTGAMIAREVERSTGGFWRPSPGSLYPALAKLRAMGLIEVVKEEKGEKYYALTERGKEFVSPERRAEALAREVMADLREILEDPDSLTGELREELVSALEEALKALKGVRQK